MSLSFTQPFAPTHSGMYDLSSDGIEIVSSTTTRSSRPPPLVGPTRSTNNNLPPPPPRPPPYASTSSINNVITLSDESDEERAQVGTSIAQRITADDDDDMMIIGGSHITTTTTTTFNKNRKTSSSHNDDDDDLEPPEDIWDSRIRGTNLGNKLDKKNSSFATSSSKNLGAQTSKNFDPNLDSRNFAFPSPSPPPPRQPLPRPNPNKKGKEKQRQEELDYDDDDDDELASVVVKKKTTVDPWALILGSDNDEEDGNGKRKKGKGKGKGKAKQVVGGNTRKRLLSDDEESEGETTTRTTKQKKAPRTSSSNEDKTSKKEQLATERANKTLLKKQETLDKLELRKANTLKTKDKNATARELTIHISGTAFKNALEEEEEEGEGNVTGKGKGRKKKEKPSPWLEITEKLEERMSTIDCAVERPEIPRRDLGCEGSIRWTRVCTTKWDEQRNMFLPLPDGQRIIVEEDTRLIFLTAHELSHHIARNTLSTFITKIQSQLAPHVNLFVLLFGLQTIFRDFVRYERAEFKRELATRAGELGLAPTKLVGIGQDQPSKDDLELAIMRMQVESRCMIVSVDKIEEAVDWLEQINWDVGQKPYQRHKQSHINMLGTQEANLPSGKDLQDTYIKMLYSLKGVAEPIAKGIAGVYPTMRSLYEAWEKCKGGEQGRKEMLSGIGKGQNVTGVATNRSIGSALSAKIYRMLTSDDPNMMI